MEERKGEAPREAERNEVSSSDWVRHRGRENHTSLLTRENRANKQCGLTDNVNDEQRPHVSSGKTAPTRPKEKEPEAWKKQSNESRGKQNAPIKVTCRVVV